MDNKSETTEITRKTRNRERITRREFNLRFKEYFKSRRFWDYTYIVLAALVGVIAYDYFIAPTTSNGITPSGVAAIARGIAVNIWSEPEQLTMQTGMYWVFYFCINFPLFVFGVIKVGWRFSIRTIVYIILQNGFHFALAYIPFINPSSFHFIVDYANLDLYQNSGGMYQIWLFVFAGAAGLLNGVAYGLLYKGGSSSAGTDFVLAYYSVKHKKSIANYNRIINYFIVIIMVLIHTLLMSRQALTEVYFGTNWRNHVNEIWANGNGLDPSNFDEINGFYGDALITYKIKHFFGPVLFASYLFVIVQSIVTDLIFPKFKYRSLMIVTSKGDAIVAGLQFIKYSNDIIRIPVRDNIAGQYVNNEVLICSTSLLEYKYVKAAIMVSDPDAKILSHKLDKLIGNFSISKY